MPPGRFGDDGFLLSNDFDALEFEEEGDEKDENDDEARTTSACRPRAGPPPPPPRFDDDGASFWNFFHCWYSSSHARSELVAEWLLETAATAAGLVEAAAAAPGVDGPLPLSPWIRRDSMGLALGGGGMAAAAATRRYRDNRECLSDGTAKNVKKEDKKGGAQLFLSAGSEATKETQQYGRETRETGTGSQKEESRRREDPTPPREGSASLQRWRRCGRHGRRRRRRRASSAGAFSFSTAAEASGGPVVAPTVSRRTSRDEKTRDGDSECV
jgi:hypothetical protein